MIAREHFHTIDLHVEKLIDKFRREKNYSVSNRSSFHLDRSLSSSRVKTGILLILLKKLRRERFGMR